MICHGMKKVRDGQSLFAADFWQKGWQMIAAEKSCNHDKKAEGEWLERVSQKMKEVGDEGGKQLRE